MIHRIDRVNPDVDDRVIKPNEARFAENLRFGASTEDTNLSGGTLILGNRQLSFLPPAGENKVVGVFSDLENRVVYFALYNSAGNHAIYRINSGTNDSVQAIVAGSWLGFLPDDTYNVSMTSVSGLLYWTDDVNEPRMVNVEKGIRTQLYLAGLGPGTDVYPSPVQDWHYTQIKRPPGEVLELSPLLNNEEMSITFGNKTTTNTGYQYSYYYVYDNNEESRLAPYTYNSFAIYNVTIRIPDGEYNNYTKQTSLIKKVVVVIRSGNDGVWRELIYQDNAADTKQSWTLKNINTSVKNTVASDITDARFDSVPLLSVTNEIAQNKLNHANYLLDYPYDNNISISAEIKPIYQITSQDPNSVVGDYFYTRHSFVPWGRYTIGVELVDKYGRTYPVTNSVDLYAPWLTQSLTDRDGKPYVRGQGLVLGKSGNNLFETQVGFYNQNDSNNTVAEFKITGQLPPWVERVNIVRSKAKNIITMHQSVGQIFQWYETPTQEPRFFSWVWPGFTRYGIPTNGRTTNVNTIYNADQSKELYTFKGFAVRFYDNPPFVPGDNLYITIYPQYNTDADDTSANFKQFKTNPIQWETDAGRFAAVVKFKVHLIDGYLIYIKYGDEIIKHPNYPYALGTTDQRYLTPWSFPVAVFNKEMDSVFEAQDPGYWTPLLYNFTLTQEGNVDDQIVYTTQVSYSRAEFEAIQNNQNNPNKEVKGYLQGDAAVARVFKNYPTTANTINLYVFPQTSQEGDDEPIITSKSLMVDSFGWFGNMISMSPRDIYAQDWNQNIGQLNTVNYKDVQNRRLPSNICFSGSVIQGTQVNGLNKFNSADFRQAPAENGAITALVTTNATQREPGVLLAIGTYGISSFYYDAIQLNNVDGSANVTTTNAYLASQRPLLGQFGTSRPMSITKTPLGTAYWWSDVVNDLVRYSNAGLERLGLTYSFGNYLRQTYAGNELITTWYDQVTDEINLVGKGIPTATFNERYKTFQGSRSYLDANGLTPERSIGTSTKFYNFVQGTAWLTDVNAPSVPDNQLLGVFKEPKLIIITNEQPSVAKTWNQIKVFGPHPLTTQLIAVANSVQSGGNLLSSIDYNWWIERKGVWEAAIRRSSTSDGGILAGKIMESRILYSIFAFDPQSFDKINFIEVKSNASIVQ